MSKAIMAMPCEILAESKAGASYTLLHQRYQGEPMRSGSW